VLSKAVNRLKTGLTGNNTYLFLIRFNENLKLITVWKAAYILPSELISDANKPD
jgi:hypothetical protein